ncbi:MAG: FHA domain-containing protein [Proteobacteria bacterium]|nr:FHA domain-containing protein [Pseudomonadota bacterium]
MSEFEGHTGGDREPQLRRVYDLRVRTSGPLVPTLTVLQGPEVGRFFVLEGPTAVFGRDEEADCRVDDPSVSRRHAVLVTRRLDDRLTVQISDEDSTNAVLVNGQVIPGSCSLISGDKLRFGDVLVRFEWMAEEELRYHREVEAKVLDR